MQNKKIGVIYADFFVQNIELNLITLYNYNIKTNVAAGLASTFKKNNGKENG